MTLIICKECGNEVSSTANNRIEVSNTTNNCTLCGAKIPKATDCGTFLGILALVFIALSVIGNSNKKNSSPSKTSSAVPRAKVDRYSDIAGTNCAEITVSESNGTMSIQQAKEVCVIVND